MVKNKNKDSLTKPFQRPTTKEQNKLLGQISRLCEQDYVINMTYPDLFDVFDRIKLGY